MKVTGLFSAIPRPLGPKGKQSGIFKFPVSSSMVTETGMEQDVQIDKRFHGGPEKALHQYALSSYEAIIKQYPLLHKRITPGCIGENISSPHLNDANVCIGDVFQMGQIKVQVSSPRIPCWKIVAKLEAPNLDKFIQEKCLTGWYYRVLQGGELKEGDEITRLEQPNPWLSVKQFMRIVNGVVDDADSISKAANAEGLDPEWKERLQRRVAIKQDEGGNAESGNI